MLRRSCSQQHTSTVCHASLAVRVHECRRTIRVPGPRQISLKVQAIGFAFPEPDPPGKPVQKQKNFKTLGVVASSLLIFQHVFKGAVGEAFLNTLATAQKYQATNKSIIEAYSKFYNLLLTAGYASWQDYLLDQILLGRDNAFARAVAQGNVEDGAPVLKAVAFDLTLLQELNTSLLSLASYIDEIAPFAGEPWVQAASSVALKRDVKQLGGGSNVQHGFNVNMPTPFIQRPATQDELQDWKAMVANKDDWAEAVPLLKQYYHLHGFGITSRNTALRWAKGAFEEGCEGKPGLPELSVLSSQRQALAANTARHCDGLPAHHVLLAGPSGTGKSHLLWEATIAAGKDKGLRIVDVTSSELHNILDIARGAARYPRVRFILVANHVDLPARGSLAADLMAGLSGGSGPSGWPSNTLLYMGASPNSTVNYGDVACFGLVLTTSHLTEQQFAGTLEELAAGQGQVDVQAAVAWAKAQGRPMTVRTAAQYLAVHAWSSS